MSLRSALLRVSYVVRGIPSKPGLDIWPTTLTIRTRTWTGGRIGKDRDIAAYVDADLVITPTPFVRELTTQEIRSSAGRYAAGDVFVEHITPAHASNPGIGYTQAQLAPESPSNAVQIIYVLTGEIAGEFSYQELTVQDAVTYTLRLRRQRSTP